MTQTTNTFYNYVLLRPDKEHPETHIVFYVGKGRGQRIKHHRMCAKRSEHCKHQTCRIYRKTWREGGDILEEKICENLPEEVSFQTERLLIHYYRSIGCPLVNLTEGGEGPTGFKAAHPTPERIEKHKKAMRYLFETTDLRDRHKQIRLDWLATEEGQKLRQRYSERMDDPEIRRQQGIANIGNTYNAKLYPGFMDPFGTIYKDVYNVKAFAKEHGLNHVQMCKLTKEQIQHHQGWTLYKSDDQLPYQPPIVYFLSPSEEIHETHCIKQFCQEQGLSYNAMTKVHAGTTSTHQGWKKYDPASPNPERPALSTCAFVSPDGHIYKGITNIAAFAESHGLNRLGMQKLKLGLRKSYKGWRQYDPENPNTSPFAFYSATFIDPDGNVWETTNVAEFARVHGLTRSTLCNLHKGKIESHRGWRKYIPPASCE